MSLITIIVPCCNEEEVIGQFHQELSRIAAQMTPVDFEILFIDDGSTDETANVIDRLREHDERVRRVSFSRNFGKEAAMFAGLQHARGDYVAIMDADLQDPPELLIPMYHAVTVEGYDCAAARRTSREGESPVRSFLSEQFYHVFNRLSSTHLVSGARDFRLMTNKMIYSILDMSEYNRFSKGIFSWVGFNTKWIEYEHADRAGGSTKWSLWKLIKYSNEGIVNFSTVPLAISTVLGVVFLAVSIVWAIGLVGTAMGGGSSAAGWPIVACLVLFAGGIQLMGIGILGQYLARTYMETKHRPLYVVRDTQG